ncbi:hypothetical protein GN956_G22739 [Arapaima gigas]
MATALRSTIKMMRGKEKEGVWKGVEVASSCSPNELAKRERGVVVVVVVGGPTHRSTPTLHNHCAPVLARSAVEDNDGGCRDRKVPQQPRMIKNNYYKARLSLARVKQRNKAAPEPSKGTSRVKLMDSSLFPAPACHQRAQ